MGAESHKVELMIACTRCGFKIEGEFTKVDVQILEHWGLPIDNMPVQFSKFSLTEPTCVGVTAQDGITSFIKV